MGLDEEVKDLEELWTAAVKFVEAHYKTMDSKDRGIKTLATINQLIELRKLRNPMQDAMTKVLENLIQKKSEAQKG